MTTKFNPVLLALSLSMIFMFACIGIKPGSVATNSSAAPGTMQPAGPY